MSLIFDTDTRREIIAVDKEMQSLKARMKALEETKRRLVFAHYFHHGQALVRIMMAKRRARRSLQN